jgi:hypothetical protein
VGFSRKRAGKDGRPRYTAYYRDIKDRECSAGTFGSKKDADKAWQRAEAKIAERRLGDPSRGRQTFQSYVEEVWLPNHEIEATTRQSYTYSIYKHVMPEFGPMRMIDILPEHVRAWVARLKDAGVTPVTIRYNKVLLSAIFTTAMNDQVVFLHPCRGVKTPTMPAAPLRWAADRAGSNDTPPTLHSRLPRSRLSSSRPRHQWRPYGPSRAIGYADH